MEPGAKKGSAGTLSHHCLLASKGRHHEVLRGAPNSIPAFNLSSSQFPMETRGPGDFCHRALAQRWDRDRKWQSVGWKGQSVRSCPQGPLCSVFLGQRNPFQPSPAWLYSTRPAQRAPGKRLSGGAPSCGYCSDDCHMCCKTETDVLGGGAGRVRGLQSSRASA